MIYLYYNGQQRDRKPYTFSAQGRRSAVTLEGCFGKTSFTLVLRLQCCQRFLPNSAQGRRSAVTLEGCFGKTSFTLVLRLQCCQRFLPNSAQGRRSAVTLEGCFG